MSTLLAPPTLYDDVRRVITGLGRFAPEDVSRGDLSILARPEGEPRWVAVLYDGGSTYFPRTMCYRPGQGRSRVVLDVFVPLAPALTGLDGPETWLDEYRAGMDEIAIALTAAPPHGLANSTTRPIPPRVMASRDRQVRLEGAVSWIYRLKSFTVEAEEY